MKRNWRHLSVALILSISLGLQAEGHNFFSHVTSQGFEAVRSLLDLDTVYLKRLLGFSKGSQDKAELSSIKHQQDVIQSVRGSLKQDLLKVEFDFRSYQKGVIDSDMGKLASYKSLLIEESPKSDRLISFLKGEGDKASREVLKEVLIGFPSQHRALLNPSFSHQELRSIFTQHPVLLHYLHELPGIADPLFFFQEKVISKDQFVNQLKTNLFHNGPHAGFWKFYSEDTIPKLLSYDKKMKNFFLNTVFEGEKNKSNFVMPKYPGPLSFEGYVHVIFDRLSQGTRGGVDKIFEEIRKFKGQSDVAKMRSLLFENPGNTILQLKKLKTLAAEEGVLKPKQKKLILELIDSSVQRLVKYNRYIKRFVSFESSKGVEILTLTRVDEKGRLVKSLFKNSERSLVISKSTVRSQAKPTIISNSTEFGDRLKAAVISLLKAEEKKNGNPLKHLDH